MGDVPGGMAVSGQRQGGEASLTLASERSAKEWKRFSATLTHLQVFLDG